jgi:hypothetical protein
MKKALFTSIILFNFLFAFSQNEKRYSIIQDEKDEILLKYENKSISIKNLSIIDNSIYFKMEEIIYKIDTSKIDLTKYNNIIQVYNNSFNITLLNFSNQAQMGLILQMLSPALLFLKSDNGIYGSIALSFVAIIIQIDSYRYLKKYSEFEKNKNNAIEYTY